MRRILAAAVALAPLCMVSTAWADDTISSGTKGPVLTSAQGNVTINSGGSVTPGTLTTTPAGCAANQPSPAAGCPLVGVFLDGPSSSVSAPAVSNSGSISNTNLPVTGGATGILIQGGTSGKIVNSGTISLSDGYAPPTNTTTGLVYSGWSDTLNPQNNYGIRLIGPGTFAGSISTPSGSVISVSGNSSYGISIEAPLDGTTSTLTLPTVVDTSGTAGTPRTVALSTAGTITVTGNNSVGVNIGGPVTKDVLLEGSITATGQGAVGLQTSAAINGRLTIGSAISATGYHYTSRPIDSTIRLFGSAPYTPESGIFKGVNTETLQGGSAVIIGGNVAGGVLLDAEPTVTTSSSSTTTTTTDVDLDGVADANQTTGSISSFGSAPALVIGGTQAVTLGVVGTTQPGSTSTSSIGIPVLTTAGQLYDFGLILKGSVTANGVFDGINATAIQLGGTYTAVVNGASTQVASGTVTIAGGGILNTGAVSATTHQAAATAIQINSGVSLPGGGTFNSTGGIYNIGGTIGASADGSGVNAAIANEVKQQATAISIANGANVPSIVNDVGSSATGGAIGAAIAGAYGNAVAIVDNGSSLKSITNSGSITALTDVSPGNTPLDESPQADYSTGYCNETPNAKTGGSGCAIAIDARNGGSLTIIQQQSTVSGAAAPTIIGDVYLPTATTASSALIVTAGSVTGTVNLGGGTVNLVVGGGSGATKASINGPLVYAATSTATSGLSIEVAKGGTLFDGVVDAARSATPQAIFANTVKVDNGGLLYAAVNPLAPANSGYYAQTADLAAGAKLGVNFINLVPTGQTVTMNFLQAGTLNIGGTVDESAIVHPFLFNVLVGTNTGGQGLDQVASCGAEQICVEASQKTAQQAQMNQSQAAFYNAAYQSLALTGTNPAAADTDLTDLFLGKSSKADFFRDYNQLMPVSGAATLLSLSSGARAISRALNDTRPVAEPGEVTGWAQELNYYANHNTDNGLGFTTHGIGVATGVEKGTPLGAFGFSTAFTSGDMKTPSQIGSSDLGATAYEAGLYWRFANNSGWRAWARGAAGYATFNSTRDFIDNPVQSLTQTTSTTTTSTNATTGKTTTTTTTDITETTALQRIATGNWAGWTASGGAGVSWEHHFLRRYYVRPEVSVEYMRLEENGYTENNTSGGINGIPLIVNSRVGHILTTAAMMDVGGRFGDVSGQGGFTVELQAGYRDNVAADPGVTTIQFVNNKGVFGAVTPDSLSGGGPVIGFRFMAGGPMGYVALEGDAEDMREYLEYVLMLRAAFRF